MLTKTSAVGQALRFVIVESNAGTIKSLKILKTSDLVTGPSTVYPKETVTDAVEDICS